MHKLDRQSAPPPACLANYRHEVNTWDDVSSTDKAAIRGCLEAMQGPRCAYCEAPVDQHGYHIEHFRRKSVFQALTFAWDNLLLCCGRNECCGHYKDRGDRQYDPNDLIEPTTDDPDEYFYFRESGAIDLRSGCNERQAHRARETLRVLNLNHPGRLQPLRRRQLQWYWDENQGVFEELVSWDGDDRREYVHEELRATADQPFCTIIRHFLQDLAS